MQRARGALEVSFVRAKSGGGSVLGRLAQQSPQRAFVHRAAGGAAAKEKEPVAVLVNTAGGVCGGDRLETRVTLEPGAHATLTTQAAERIYRAIDVDATIDVELRLGPEARLHWVPQETIVFDRARLRRRTTIDAAPESRWIAGETLVFGRRAMGEHLSAVRLMDDWRIRIGDRLVWADAFRLEGDPPAALLGRSGLAGHEALSTLVVMAQDPERVRDTLRRDIEADAILGGATIVHGLVLARLLGAAAPLRAALTRALEGLREHVLGFDPSMPRVWHC